MERICLVKEDINSYPDFDDIGRPSMNYPEYPFEDISHEDNRIYQMVREGLFHMQLDIENYGSSLWNPLGMIVKPGNCVLVKPNLVLDENASGCGVDCLYTQPSVVAPVIDYIWIALKGEGKIVIGDAPLQECDFEKLAKQSGYDILIDYYRKKGIDIELVDFRNVKTCEKNGLHYLREDEGLNGVIVQLDEDSAFADFNDDQLERLRITNYDPRILRQHHYGNKHEYNVSQYVLNADVIINMPKPKTHRKAGVTISLKNLVGINANKEFLPHHMLGGKDEGGDAYLNGNSYLSMANEVLDIRNKLMHEEQFASAELAVKLYEKLLNTGQKQTSEEYWEGSWYGNDTIWRTIVDLNRILLYADKNGIMQHEKQRKLFIIADMIVSGQKEGPLEPTPIYPGVIAMGQEPLLFDRVICSIMGFDYKKIPTLYNDEICQGRFSVSEEGEYCILSNYEGWNHKSMEYVRDNESLEFEPTYGWMKKLGNRYRNHIIETIKKCGNKVYVFGVGNNGIYAANELMKENIGVVAFLDNNKSYWGTDIISKIKCVNPKMLDKNILIIIATRDRYVWEIKEQLEQMGGKVVGCINRG